MHARHTPEEYRAWYHANRDRLNAQRRARYAAGENPNRRPSPPPIAWADPRVRDLGPVPTTLTLEEWKLANGYDAATRTYSDTAARPDMVRPAYVSEGIARADRVLRPRVA